MLTKMPAPHEGRAFSFVKALDNVMKLKLNVPIIVGDRCYNPGDVLDLEIDGEVKKRLVNSRDAEYWEEKEEEPKAPQFETATLHDSAYEQAVSKGQTRKPKDNS